MNPWLQGILDGTRAEKLWGLPNSGYFVGHPYKKGGNILGSILGSPVLQNYHIGLGFSGQKALTLSCLSVEIGLIEGPLLYSEGPESWGPHIHVVYPFNRHKPLREGLQAGAHNPKP